MACGRCRRTPKKLPYGIKGWTYCSCDQEMVQDISKKGERAKAASEAAEGRFAPMAPPKLHAVK